MTGWIKENLVLVSGILLPIILVGGFFMLSKAPQMLVDPPTHDFLLVGYRYDYQIQKENDYLFSFEVKNGKLTGEISARDDSNVSSYHQIASLYHISSDKQVFKEHRFEIPDDIDDLDSPVALNLEVTDHLRLDESAESPDGFQFERNHGRGRGGLLGEIFGMNRRYESSLILRKDNAVFVLPQLPDQQYVYNGNLEFMGWVVAEGAER